MKENAQSEILNSSVLQKKLNKSEYKLIKTLSDIDL